MADQQIVERLRKGKSKASTSPTESAKTGANRITDFINQISDEASNQVADAIAAATIQKAMLKLGVGDGPLTQVAMSQFSDAFTQVLVTDLPSLTGADGGDSQYFLPLEVEKKPENLN